MSQGYITGLGKDARVHGFDGQWLTKSEIASFAGNRGDNGIYIVDDVMLSHLSEQDTGYMMRNIFSLVLNGQGVYLHEPDESFGHTSLKELKALIKDKSYADIRPLLSVIEDKLTELNEIVRSKEDNG